MKPLGEYFQRTPALRAWMGLFPLVAPFLVALAIFGLLLRALERSVPEAHGGIAGAAEAPVGARTPILVPTAGPRRFAGTVTAVDRGAGTADVVTGVGLALRIRRVHLPSALEVGGRARGPASEVLKPGAIVRVECRPDATLDVASGVILLREAPGTVTP